MPFELQWTPQAVNDLNAFDRTTADRITKKVVWYSRQDQPLRFSQPLEGAHKGVYRFRIGSYRVLFESDPRGQLSILMILRVKHRRDAYR